MIAPHFVRLYFHTLKLMVHHAVTLLMVNLHDAYGEFMTQFVMANPKTCIGCHACEVACVITANQGKHPELREHFLPRITVHKQAKNYTATACRQCENAPCAKVCPTTALEQRQEHVHLDKSRCIGCKACIIACPFGAIRMVDESVQSVINIEQTPSIFSMITAHKCDLCQDRRASPACVAACPTQSLTLIDQDTLIQQQRQKQQKTAFCATADRTMLMEPPPQISVSPFVNLQQMPRQNATKIALEQRKTTFTEIYNGFTSMQTEQQAQRCFSCGPHSVCEWRCPLHNRIPHWIKLAKEGRILEAVELSHYTNSLPEITGRVCPQDRLCEGSCTLKNETDAVTIGNIERYITDNAFAMGWRPDLSYVKPTGKKVAIIGAGPAGLACADILVRNGISPVVFDRHPEIGGMLTFGIPSFKLDKEVLIRRREIFTDMGIEFQLNTDVGKDVSITALIDEYDALFVGVGTYRSMQARLENEDANGVYKALSYLTANTKQLMGLPELAHQPYINLQGKRVVVLGGGDTAMDCVRTAIRQGAIEVTCAYRRDESNMPGSKKEVNNAREEGANFLFMMQPIKIEVNDQGNVIGIRMLKTKLGDPDLTGRRVAQPIPDSEFLLEADAVIIAFGFNAHNLEWLQAQGVTLNRWGTIIAPPVNHEKLACQTTHPKIFAGGDIVRGADLVVTAIADGRMAANSILQYLGLESQIPQRMESGL